ncbi:MAG: hypothetical protein IT555_00585 [Acetobacteraceae bacterium]|nr:hypothetical protein [Acetobacteraceae bacterium]
MAQFVLVRHSAYAAAADPAFEGRLEAAEVDAPQSYRARAAGGTLYPTREAAEAAIQGAKGYFANLRIAGAELFIHNT